jgi:putative oxidoreductase
MATTDDFSKAWTPRALAVLRIVTAFLFVQHGTAKLFGFPHVAMFDSLSVMSLIGFAGISK